MDEKEKSELANRVSELERIVRSFFNSSEIPLEVSEAFRERLFSGVPIIFASSKGADTEDQAVAEGGSSSYSVLGDPDGFVEVNVGGTVRYLPYY